MTKFFASSTSKRQRRIQTVDVGAAEVSLGPRNRGREAPPCEAVGRAGGGCGRGSPLPPRGPGV
jgi:hypothetical protein